MNAPSTRTFEILCLVSHLNLNTLLPVGSYTITRHNFHIPFPFPTKSIQHTTTKTSHKIKGKIVLPSLVTSCYGFCQDPHTKDLFIPTNLDGWGLRNKAWRLEIKYCLCQLEAGLMSQTGHINPRLPLPHPSLPICFFFSLSRVSI